MTDEQYGCTGCRNYPCRCAEQYPEADAEDTWLQLQAVLDREEDTFLTQDEWKAVERRYRIGAAVEVICAEAVQCRLADGNVSHTTRQLIGEDVITAVIVARNKTNTAAPWVCPCGRSMQTEFARETQDGVILCLPCANQAKPHNVPKCSRVGCDKDGLNYGKGTSTRKYCDEHSRTR